MLEYLQLKSPSSLNFVINLENKYKNQHCGRKERKIGGIFAPPICWTSRGLTQQDGSKKGKKKCRRIKGAKVNWRTNEGTCLQCSMAFPADWLLGLIECRIEAGQRRKWAFYGGRGANPIGNSEKMGHHSVPICRAVGEDGRD